VVILNWNGAPYTIACYESVRRQTFSDIEVIIVDNASTDGSADVVAARCPDAKLVRNPTNGGTGGGFAVGADHACGEIVLFLCNDTELDSDAIEKMMAVMDARPDCGVCGAKQVYHDRPDIVDCVGYLPDRFGFLHFYGIREPDDGRTDLKESWINGTVFMIRRNVYDLVGGYDRLLFTLNDEVDLCWRVHTHGYTTLVCQAARVRHHNSATLSLAKKARTRFWAERHLLRMLLKNYSTPTLLFRILPQYALLQAAEILFLAGQGLFAMGWSDLRAIGWNLRHLPGTWREHRRLNRTRTVSDRALLKTLWPRCVKIEWGLQLLRECTLFRSTVSTPRAGSGMK
jgi:GT2 family glycosyltransferase